MILFFSGVLSVIGLIAMFGAGYLIGQKQTPKQSIKAVDEELVRKRQKMHEHFNKLMTYDVDVARGKKVK